MKRIVILAGLALWTAAQFSCINSLNPLVTFKDVTRENRIVGDWEYAGRHFRIESLPKSKFAKELEKGIFGNDVPTSLKGKEKEDSILYSKAYVISYSKDDVEYALAAAIMKINGNYFLDLYPIGMSDTSGKEDEGVNNYGVEYHAAFTIGKLEISPDNKNIRIRFVDGDFVQKHIEGGNMRVRYEKDQITGSFLVTASTSELQQFMQKYGDDDRLFSEKQSINLSRQ